MNPETILQIILQSLILANRATEHMTPEQWQKFWERHEKNLQFWEDLFKGLQPKGVVGPLPKPDLRSQG